MMARTTFATAAFVLLLPCALAATTPAVPAPPISPQAAPLPLPDGLILPYDLDRTARMTVPVMIDGEGPFPFVVDTGAERTVLAAEVADLLKLPAGRTLTLATITGLHDTRSARISTLAMASHKVRDVEAPMLARYNLGAAGLVGIDSLQNSKVQFDFRKNALRILPSRKAIAETFWTTNRNTEEIVVRASRRAGRMILSDAIIDGMRVDVIVDTGAQASIGNLALRNKKLKRGAKIELVDIHGVTGDRLSAEIGTLDRVKLGAVDIRKLPVAYADSHAFTALGLDRRPALLLGMDALSLFDGIEIDFGNRQVVFALPKHSARDPATRLVEAAPRPGRSPAPDAG